MPALTQPPGTLVLGRYRLRDPLGAGGFGSVWSARDERLERDVAVKLLPRERVIGGRFEREARAAARLSHPAIVTLYEAAVDDHAAYLVSELVRGATFAELLEVGRLSDHDVVAIGIALCDALEHAHAQGVVHRDVKPSNVLVPDHPFSPQQVAKLTDFGVARLLGGAPLTRTGEVVGTDAYMAPEQSEGRDADAAADLYSLGLVLYEALTGLNPVAGGTAARRSRRLGARLPPVRRHRRDLPSELGRAIDLALEPQPPARGTVAALRSTLLHVVGRVEDRPGVVAPAWPTRATLPRRTWPEPASPREPADEPPPPSARMRAPDRALAAAAAAAVAVWLSAGVLASPPVAPAVAALVAAVAVAALPRAGWIALNLIAAAGLLAQTRSGEALVLLIGAALPILLLPRSPTRWPVAAAAPVLGAVTLAGAWPALAGRDTTAWRRAALGAIGWVWIVLSALIAGRGSYLGLPRDIPPHTLWPVLHDGVLAPALLWASAALLLPWIVRGPAALRVVLVVVWSAALGSATSAALRVLHTGAVLNAGAAALGAVAAAVLVLLPTFLSARRRSSSSADPAARLA